MEEDTTSTLTKKYLSATDRHSGRTTKSTATTSSKESQKIIRLGNLLAGLCAFAGAILSGSDLRLSQVMENQVQSAFYQLRGSIAPPENIVILAIDDNSISKPEQYYRSDPQKFAFFEPVQTFPFKREAYAQVIEKLYQAGASAIALDVVFDLPSSHGREDDKKLLAALQRYGSKVSLAAFYEEFYEGSQQFTKQLRQPQEMFRGSSALVGSVNFPLELEGDGKIHRLASEYLKQPDQSSLFSDSVVDKLPDFDTATLRAANIDFPKPKGDRIYFRGSAGTFETIPFWQVLDPDFWNNNLNSGKVFRNKIVVIGATAQLSNDFHPVAVNWLFAERMSGVEIHANAIATLMEGNAIAIAIPNLLTRSLFVCTLVGGIAYLISRNKYNRIKIISSFACAIIWGGISYITFISTQLFFPTAVPIMGILAVGISYLVSEIILQQLRKKQLVDIIRKNPSSRIAQEILSQQEEIRDLLLQRELEISGKVLDGRYRIVKVLGSGGFSETYIAEDTRLPGNPLCVVKQLQPVNNKPEQMEVARRLFSSEAQTLQKLGSYPQIPQLLAYFEEEDEFYLVQEYILGNTLSQEIPSGKCNNQAFVIEILCDILQTLALVHENGVIHRDIKPSNIMRRKCDRKLVLIDFGAVKQVSTDLLENLDQTAMTIGIGTKGYAPTEQCLGKPQYSSDIYAVGMIAIKALTGISPHELEHDESGQLIWLDRADINHYFAEVLNKMVCENFQERYQSTSEVITALNQLILSQNIESPSSDNSSINTLSLDDCDTPTTPWDGLSGK
ncbi:serine/threonine-protein kinase [Brunnivagina elsteri]|uniref:non-specific serine/threonine protein kinase n=1 Tax=Brunnivagina elsteri CCALA 953 TaxID=987040 RepID=A0A2A2TJ83_9CYAN|nr:serine/threonine-protein kinase [Calothrix elsteri]PAX54342.1 protein kinase [Calothrix elsteri CCALA 953]